MTRTLVLVVLLACPWTHTMACGGGKPEKFDKFFGRFVKEADFAKSRTLYPLVVSMVERDSKEVSESSISKRDDEGSPALGDFMQANQLGFAGVQVTRAAATVSMFRAEPTWRLGYRFVLERGCWYLKEIEDRAD